MATSNILTLLPPDKTDVMLIALCAAFIRLEAEISEHERAHASDYVRGLGLPLRHERKDECTSLLRELCQQQSTYRDSG